MTRPDAAASLGVQPALTEADLLRPRWPLPPGVGAAMSTRTGGVSSGPWGSCNLGAFCGDAPAAVAENRRRWAARLGAQPVWLRQVHGAAVRRLTRPASPDDESPADAAWTDEPGLACTVLVADCLPVLLAVDDGRAVAAAHAGWRGLAGGVLESTVAALCAGSGAAPARLQAWVGPGIGPQRFEVGEDVLQAFGATAAAPGPHFRPRPRDDGAMRWLADLPALAVLRLQALGLGRVFSDGSCTASDGSRFFSFRRDGVCGRMAAAIWRC